MGAPTAVAPTDRAELDAVDLAVRAAAASGLDGSSRADRAAWLRALADVLARHADELVALAHAETHLSTARLGGEVVRTATQLRFFADVITEGSYLEATLDSPDPALIPPRPDLRRMLRPLGVVAVFAASNFPFAFSVLGNDTASALAAGCPVVVKAHPGHPALSRRVAELAREALPAAGGPADALVLVEGLAAGAALVQHPLVSAVGFTGSTRGGRALFDLASARPAPIPFYGELGSVNPVVITPSAVEASGAEIAQGLAGSFTRDGGQYCTKPGLVFVPPSAAFDEALEDATAGSTGQRLLTGGISAAFDAGADELGTREGVQVLARAGALDGEAAPVVATIGVDVFLADPVRFQEEHFGPLTLLVRYDDPERLEAALAVLEGSLTGTVWHAPDDDDAFVAASTAALSRIAGRVLFNGWPTGVAIAWGQHHGGPWPASTASVHTSVGATAIRRFLTPLTFQDAPQSVLPAELRDGNPLSVPRREDGEQVGG
ncbi:aldehyde dehydrogenase (NADP(+)) [Microbacterium capsulatum]|uniref:Aldehyde dehydrogenase (NADP(+)) n=1 Tax=Microbacterium capsulatum TaxID=3041921 RepID=A0ABU0XDE5_9MICO|nr:aldehyde dehydrogenase (NADP(+)) [Microbacterium sp. ASV81]MDQ4213116.1 aldehyde dehydrogenase (NADP(+)) [Microbacterium sp. ASV81]